MKRATVLALLLGAVLFVVLLWHYGAGEIAAATAAAGWGLLYVSAFRFVTIATDTLGWRVLFSEPARPTLGRLFLFRWVGEAVNSLLPVAQVGGDVARARLAAQAGVPSSEAGATVVVDFTLGLVTQFLYAVLGAALFMSAGRPGSEIRGLWIGLLIAAGVLVLFYLAQHSSLFRRLAGTLRFVSDERRWGSLAGHAAGLDLAVSTLYGHRGRVAACGVWRLGTWVLHTGETWLALYALGSPVSWTDAFILECLGTAIRSAAFAVPGGLGVQEGGFVLIGMRLGLSPEVSLALALVKRVRELLVGGPGLMVWTTLEGRGFARFFSRRP